MVSPNRRANQHSEDDPPPCEIFITMQVCTFYDGCKQGIDQQIFNRKSISRKIAHPQSSAVQACRNVSSRPLFSKAEVSDCRMRSFDISDAEIQTMSSINLRKSSASFSTSAIGCRM